MISISPAKKKITSQKTKVQTRHSSCAWRWQAGKRSPRACCQGSDIAVAVLPDPLPSREGSPGTGEDAAAADTSSRLKDISSLFLCTV